MMATTFSNAQRRAHTWPRPRGARLWLWLVGASLLLAGCGDSDGGASAPASTPAVPQRAQPKKPQAGEAGAGLRFHAKIEDLYDPEEIQEVRHVFSPDDFRPDLAGGTKRDPFRSLAVAQMAAARNQETRKVDPTQACKDLVADSYSLRDLRLVGIVLRGSRSYALFVDKGSQGHIVTRGDCLGQEKARVLSVRAGFVTLQIIPEAAQGVPDSALQERTIALYPDELPVDGELP